MSIQEDIIFEKKKVGNKEVQYQIMIVLRKHLFFYHVGVTLGHPNNQGCDVK